MWVYMRERFLNWNLFFWEEKMEIPKSTSIETPEFKEWKQTQIDFLNDLVVADISLTDHLGVILNTARLTGVIEGFAYAKKLTEC